MADEKPHGLQPARAKQRDELISRDQKRDEVNASERALKAQPAQPEFGREMHSRTPIQCSAPSGERTRLACWFWRPRQNELFFYLVGDRIVGMRVCAMILAFGVTASVLAADVRDLGVQTGWSASDATSWFSTKVTARSGQRHQNAVFDERSQTESITVAQIARTPAQLRLADRRCKKDRSFSFWRT